MGSLTYVSQQVCYIFATDICDAQRNTIKIPQVSTEKQYMHFKWLASSRLPASFAPAH